MMSSVAVVAAAVVGALLGPVLRGEILRHAVPAGVPWRDDCPHCSGTLLRPGWRRLPATLPPSGACPRCGRRIGPPPGTVEVLAASLLALLAWRVADPLALAAFAWLAALGVILAFVDVAVHRLPDRLTLAAFTGTLLPLGAGLVVGILVLNLYGRYVTRRRLMGQVIIESLMLAIAGGVGAILVAYWGRQLAARVMLSANDAPLPLDGRIIAYAALAALAAGIIAGLVPAVHATRADIAAALKEGAREGRSSRSRTRVGLLMLQSALTVVLLAGTGLFVRSLWKLDALRLGMDTEQVLAVEVQTAGTSYSAAEMQQITTAIKLAGDDLDWVASGEAVVATAEAVVTTQAISETAGS